MGKRWKGRGTDQGEKETEGQARQGGRVTGRAGLCPLVLPHPWTVANFTNWSRRSAIAFLLAYSIFGRHRVGDDGDFGFRRSSQAKSLKEDRFVRAVGERRRKGGASSFKASDMIQETYDINCHWPGHRSTFKAPTLPMGGKLPHCGGK
jgi:hypothetical protein